MMRNNYLKLKQAAIQIETSFKKLIEKRQINLFLMKQKKLKQIVLYLQAKRRSLVLSKQLSGINFLFVFISNQN